MKKHILLTGLSFGLMQTCVKPVQPPAEPMQILESHLEEMPRAEQEKFEGMLKEVMQDQNLEGISELAISLNMTANDIMTKARVMRQADGEPELVDARSLVSSILQAEYINAKIKSKVDIDRVPELVRQDAQAHAQDVIAVAEKEAEAKSLGSVALHTVGNALLNPDALDDVLPNEQTAKSGAQGSNYLKRIGSWGGKAWGKATSAAQKTGIAVKETLQNVHSTQEDSAEKIDDMSEYDLE